DLCFLVIHTTNEPTCSGKSAWLFRGNGCMLVLRRGGFRRAKATRTDAANVSGCEHSLDHESPKVSSDRCAWFIVVVAPRRAGRRLAPVARAESRWRRERDRPHGVVSDGMWRGDAGGAPR